MKKSNSKSKAQGAFWKLGVVALITATIFFVACKQTNGGGGGGKQGAPFVEGGASLILSPDNLTIKVKAKTADGSAITVEGCKETTLASEAETTLTATGTTVILKGNITGLECSSEYSNMGSLTALNVQGLTALQMLDCQGNRLTSLNVQGLTALQELYCGGNKLPELNVQGLTALQELYCGGNKLTELNVQGLTALKNLWFHVNQLNAQAMTKLLNALPAREAGDNAEAVLYAEVTGFTEGNCKDFSQPAELKTAFDGAKKKNWKLKKMNASENLEDI